VGISAGTDMAVSLIDYLSVLVDVRAEASSYGGWAGT
jgi:hypothetical protein